MTNFEPGNDTLDAIPPIFSGVPYGQFLSELSIKRNVQRYIEVGVSDGSNLSSIHADTAIGVDPDFNIKNNVAANKKKILLCQMTSDAFFSNTENFSIFKGSPDLIFLDGFHAFEFLLRDFFNAESICDSKGLIFLHDCLPLNAEMAERDMNKSIEAGMTSKFPNYWTGDVWKIIPILFKYRPDLRLKFIDCPPTGLVAITKLDPQSNVLRENYLSIVDEFIDHSNKIEAIHDLYKSISITSSEKVLSSYDNTLYFMT